MERSAQTFTLVGLALFGSFWQNQLGEVLDVSRRTIARWAAGSHPIPAPIWAELSTICLQRGRSLTAIASQIVSQKD